jgi:hypothetical protein
VDLGPVKEGQCANAVERAGIQKVNKLFQCIQGEVVGGEVGRRGRVPMVGEWRLGLVAVAA